VEDRAGAGCGMHGHSETRGVTPLTALEMAKWLPEVGVPPGVLNIVTGSGRYAARR